MYNPFSLENKTILITGAASGIGRSTAIACSQLGARLIVTDINKEQLNDTFNKLEGNNKEHLQFVVNLTQEEEIEKMVNDLPMLDGCANIAGVGKTSPIQFFNKEDIEKIYSINLQAPIFLTKYLVKKKKMNKPSSIVFLVSIAGVYSYTIGNGIYGSSKAALNSYMKYAAKELAPKGIRCNSVNPGMINTPFIAMDAFTQETSKADMEKYPLKRYGNPEEVAYAVIYLLSGASSFVTGHSLVIDGGKSLN